MFLQLVCNRRTINVLRWWWWWWWCFNIHKRLLTHRILTFCISTKCVHSTLLQLQQPFDFATQNTKILLNLDDVSGPGSKNTSLHSNFWKQIFTVNIAAREHNILKSVQQQQINKHFTQCVRNEYDRIFITISIFLSTDYANTFTGTWSRKSSSKSGISLVTGGICPYCLSTLGKQCVLDSSFFTLPGPQVIRLNYSFVKQQPLLKCELEPFPQVTYSSFCLHLWIPCPLVQSALQTKQSTFASIDELWTVIVSLYDPMLFKHSTKLKTCCQLAALYYKMLAGHFLEHTVYTMSGRQVPLYFLPLTLPNAANFQNSFTSGLRSKFLAKLQ